MCRSATFITQNTPSTSLLADKFFKLRLLRKMLELVEDVLFLILDELQGDRKSLYSCILVNRTWCKITVPILWNNPGRNYLTDNAMNKLFNVIILHLSKES